MNLEQITRSFLPALTQPVGEIAKGHQVVVLLVQQGEGAVCQRVGVLVGDPGPRRQQPVKTLELSPIEPELPLQVGATGDAVMPGCCLCRRRRASVPPVQTDEVLRLEEEGGAYLPKRLCSSRIREGGGRRDLEEVVDVREQLWRDGDFWGHQPQLHRQKNTRA